MWWGIFDVIQRRLILTINFDLYIWFWCDNTVDLEHLGNSQKACRHESTFLTTSSCTGCKVHRWPTAFLDNECVDILAMRRERRERGDCRFDYEEIFFEIGFSFEVTKFICLFTCWLNHDRKAKSIVDEVFSYEKWVNYELIHLSHKTVIFIQVCGKSKIMVM